LSIHVRFIETFESLLDNRRALCEQPLLVGAFSLRRDLVHLCGRFAKLEGRMHERVLVWNLGYELFRKLGLKKNTKSVASWKEKRRHQTSLTRSPCTYWTCIGLLGPIDAIISAQEATESRISLAIRDSSGRGKYSNDT
jgi:hypothetical protein